MKQQNMFLLNNYFIIYLKIKSTEKDEEISNIKRKNKNEKNSWEKERLALQ